MATEEALKVISLQSAADFSTTGQYRFGTVNASGQIAIAGSAARVDGIIQGNPDAADRAVGVGISGVSLIELGATLTAGDDIQSGANGLAAAGTTKATVTLLESGVSGDIVSCLLKA